MQLWIRFFDFFSHQSNKFAVKSAGNITFATVFTCNSRKLCDDCGLFMHNAYHLVLLMRHVIVSWDFSLPLLPLLFCFSFGSHQRKWYARIRYVIICTGHGDSLKWSNHKVCEEITANGEKSAPHENRRQQMRTKARAMILKWCH